MLFRKGSQRYRLRTVKAFFSASDINAGQGAGREGKNAYPALFPASDINAGQGVGRETRCIASMSVHPHVCRPTGCNDNPGVLACPKGDDERR